jgi:hypothetical protein
MPAEVLEVFGTTSGCEDAPMEAAQVDPRDISWEVGAPTYRVYFWSRVDVSPGVAAGCAGWVADEWRLTRARDVHEVLTWAEQRRGGRSYTLYAEFGGEDGMGMVNLAGIDPTSTR